MSLSRPARFPLLKLPFLCIECVIKSWNIVDMILFALTSKRARQIVKHLKIPLNRIRIFLSDRNWITLNNRFERWHFREESESLLDKEHHNSSKFSLVLQKNATPLYTRKANNYLESYTKGNEKNDIKMALGFLNGVFKCSVEEVNIYGDNFPESGNIGVCSTMNLCVTYINSHAFGQNQNQKLNLLLENLKSTNTCSFYLTNTKKDFYCDPKLFKCKKLVFGTRSAAWVTREILLQFEVSQLKFEDCPFSVQDILSFVTNWFHSENKKSEYLFITIQDTQISLENFQTEELKLVSFSERNRVPIINRIEFARIDFSKGLEIVRHDGLLATIHAGITTFMFYIWHNQ